MIHGLPAARLLDTFLSVSCPFPDENNGFDENFGSSQALLDEAERTFLIAQRNLRATSGTEGGDP